MKKTVLLAAVITVCFVFGITATVFGGNAASPFLLEINKLNAIELNLAAVHNRMQHVYVSTSFPPPLNYFDATANKVYSLDIRLMDVLSVLPQIEELGDDGEEVILSLDGIRTDAQDTVLIMERMARNMGIEPPPLKEPLLSIINRINAFMGTVPVY